MQETFDWTPPQGPLGRLVEKAAARVAGAGFRLSELQARSRDCPPAPDFEAALKSGTSVALIAEVKRRSPSKGEIRQNLDAPQAAALYANAGARAISVLTEPSEFGGSLTDLVDVSRAVSLPTLRKDFHVDEGQIWEARIAGAAAVLLIARALEPGRLRALFETTREAEIGALVEVRSERELDQAIGIGADVIGVNSRDLETLQIDASVGERILRQISPDKVAVAESGITSQSDVERVARAGADAVLVGSALSSSSDPAGLVRVLTKIGRTSRGS